MPASQVSFFFFFSTNVNILNIYSLHPRCRYYRVVPDLPSSAKFFESILLQVYSVSSVSRCIEPEYRPN